MTVTIGTTAVPASFAGLVAVGEFQINFTVPQLSDGVYPVTITVNGVASPENINTNPPGPLGDSYSTLGESKNKLKGLQAAAAIARPTGPFRYTVAAGGRRFPFWGANREK